MNGEGVFMTYEMETHTMRFIIIAAAVFTLLLPALGVCESMAEFMKAKERAEEQDLVPKLMNDMMPKQVIVERIASGGEVDFSGNAIQFKYGAWELTKASYEQLKQIAAAIQDPALAKVQYFYVDGHTCSVGSEDNNCILSSRRARSVVRYLVREVGVPPNKLVARGFGEYRPKASNDSEEGRTTNRRVVLKMGSPEDKGTVGEKECP
jgi:outer membrane protein OmpA-like peptidoglycan-associated protein